MKNKFNTQILLPLFIAMLPAALFSAEVDTKATKASALIKGFMAETQSPGVAITIGQNGKVLWSEGFGYADIEQRVPVWPAITRFRVGSVAKPMTTVALAKLYEQGRLDLDAPIQKYVPSFPEKEGTITTRLLAGHLAGIRHYKGDEFFILKHYPSVLESLTIFRDDPLLHPPGSKFSCSSYAWNLISAVIEAASGREFLGYMDENVFGPTGMTRTTADQVNDIISNRTRYYHLVDGVLRNAPPVDNSYKWAGGGFLSTSEDLVRFGFAHIQPGLLKPETVEMLWTSQKTTSGEETGYGIGWRSGTDDSGRRWAGHGGGSVGGRTFLRIYPEEQTVVVIITNMSNVRYGDVAEKIAGLFLE